MRVSRPRPRELHPKGVRIVVDGGIANGPPCDLGDSGESVDTMLDPEAIAASSPHLIGQHRSARAREIELGPWTETF